MSCEFIRLKTKDDIATITLCRAEKLNALDGQMVGELADLLRKIDADNGIKVVIITGDGGKAFSAGGDIAAWSGESASAFAFEWVRHGHEAFDRLARLRQPVIAVLNGHALGGGLELAACADYRIGEAHIKLGQPESGLGIIAGWSGTQRAVRRFGSQTVRRMAMFGEVFKVEEGRQLGIVDKVVKSGEGLKSALMLAETIKSKSPKATQLTKMLINAAEGEERERVLEALAGHVAADSLELEEGLRAYREKRKPDF